MSVLLAASAARLVKSVSSWLSAGTGLWRCAAAINSVKGEANAVNRRRGWASPLDASLFANNVSRPTFDAMQQAVTDSLPDFRNWLRVKVEYTYEGLLLGSLLSAVGNDIKLATTTEMSEE